MIKRRASQFLIISMIFIAFYTLFLQQISLEKSAQKSQQDVEKFSIIISRIDLLLLDGDVRSRQGFSNFLQRLSAENAVSGWKLYDENGHLLSKKTRFDDSEVYQHKIYFTGYSDRTFNLELEIPLEGGQMSSGLSIEFLSFLVLLFALFGVAMNRFRWLLMLESYAQYILTNDNQMNSNIFKRASNPISQAINQLILNNSHLAKDKVDLTEQIRKISYIDETTELGNQLFFKAEFEVRLHNHEEDESGLLMLLSFIDYDSSDNQVLDGELLRSLANFLRHFVSKIPNALVARLRENDFALLLPNQTKELTDKLCKSLIEQLDKGIFDSTSLKEHFVDIGISAYKQGFDYYKVLAEADMALRNSQLQGGNSWFMFGQALSSSKVRGSLKWRSFLQRTLDQRKVELYGQRAFYFANDKKEFQEVFARIEDGKEILTAETFLPMANQCGLATEFDRQVVDGVIKHCLYCEEDNENIYSINLFIASLLDERFVGWLVGKLSSYPELCHRLYFEIKEAQINQHLSQLKVVCQQLVELGIHWSVKRFGSPDENLAYLDILPISRVKLDRRIINNIHLNKPQQLLLQTLLINLKSKKIDVFADGVEKKEDADFLENSGITAAQGYFYARPQRLKKAGGYLKVV